MELKQRTLQGKVNYLVRAAQEMEADLREQSELAAQLRDRLNAKRLRLLADGSSRALVLFAQLASEEGAETEVTNSAIPPSVKGTQNLYEMVITWYDGRHCHADTLCFWASPDEYHEKALELFLMSYSRNDADTDSIREQWFYGNGQIVLAGDPGVLYEIDYLDIVAPVVVCMDGSTVVAVTHHGRDVPYDIEQIR